MERKRGGGGREGEREKESLQKTITVYTGSVSKHLKLWPIFSFIMTGEEGWMPPSPHPPPPPCKGLRIVKRFAQREKIYNRDTLNLKWL